MVFNMISELFSAEKRQYRRVAETLGPELGKSDNVCFGRYDAADDVLKALYKEGMLKDKNIYTASKRTNILAKRYGLEPMSPSLLRKNSTTDFIYVENEEELENVVNILGEAGIDPGDFEKAVVYSHIGSLGDFAKSYGFKKILSRENADAMHDFVFIDGVDQMERENHDMLVGNDMKRWFTTQYPLKLLKKLIYSASSFVALVDSSPTEYLGEQGKGLVVEYKPGTEKQVLSFLRDDARVIPAGTTMDDARILYGKSFIRGKRKRLVTANAKNIMALPFNSKDIIDRGQRLIEYERDVEMHPLIGEKGTGLVSMRKPNIGLLIGPDGRFDVRHSYQS